MSTVAGRGLRPGGVVRAFGRLAVLVVFGFSAGLLMGVLLEEPELLAGHLRGQSEAVVLAPARTTPQQADFDGTDDRASVMADRGDEGSNEPLPRVASSRTADTGEAPVDSALAKRTTTNRPIMTRSTNTNTKSNDQSIPWAIQVGAFSDQTAAERLAKALGEKGYPTELINAKGANGRWRVRVQPIDGEANAREMATKLKREERLPTWVLRAEASAR